MGLARTRTSSPFVFVLSRRDGLREAGGWITRGGWATTARLCVEGDGGEGVVGRGTRVVCPSHHDVASCGVVVRSVGAGRSRSRCGEYRHARHCFFHSSLHPVVDRSRKTQKQPQNARFAYLNTIHPSQAQFEGSEVVEPAPCTRRRRR